MHPDAIIAALKRELESARDDEHKKQIRAEIERVDKLPRPAAKAEEPETVFDRNRAILDALKEELQHARDKDHEAAVKAEIKRVEGELEQDAESAEGDLDAKTRDELNELASSLGIENPDKLPNKGAVADAIRDAQESAGE